MSARFVNIDHDTPLLLTPDLLSSAFHQILELDARARVLQVGAITVSIGRHQNSRQRQ